MKTYEGTIFGYWYRVKAESKSQAKRKIAGRYRIEYSSSVSKDALVKKVKITKGG